VGASSQTACLHSAYRLEKTQTARQPAGHNCPPTRPVLPRQARIGQQPCAPGACLRATSACCSSPCSPHPAAAPPFRSHPAPSSLQTPPPQAWPSGAPTCPAQPGAEAGTGQRRAAAAGGQGRQGRVAWGRQARVWEPSLGVSSSTGDASLIMLLCSEQASGLAGWRMGGLALGTAPAAHLVVDSKAALPA
jgi:hypothetical protein